MPGKTSFQDKWISGGLIKRPWLSPVKDDKYSAFCLACRSTIKISNGGVTQVVRHENTEHHKKELVKFSSQRTFVTGKDLALSANEGSSRLSKEESILSAEILQCLHLVDANQSFNSAEGDGERFRRMFPDSEIAKGYRQGKTKANYVVQFGIAPAVKEQLVREIKDKQFCFHFDETTTSQVKKQYDGYVTYYSSSSKNILTSYGGSLFLGHCTAHDLLNHFFAFIEKLDLSVDNNLLNVGMDGPSVNLKFERELREELKKRGTSFISVGGCSLHTVYNGFGKGMNSLKDEGINLDQFVIDLHFFFERSAARREDFKEVSKITDISVHYLMRHCETRWLSIEKVLVRIIEQFDNIKVYFLDELPKSKGFSYKQGIGNTPRYKRIASFLNDKCLLVYMSFIVFISQDFRQFLLPSQTSSPMIHVLHSMQMKLIQNLLSKFIDPKYFKSSDGRKLLPAKEIVELDVKDKKKHIAKLEIGVKANTVMFNLKLDALEKKKVLNFLRGFLESSSEYLIRNLPITCRLLKSAKCLHPAERQKTSSLNSISYLAQSVAKALGEESMKNCFNLKDGKNSFDLIDIMRKEFMEYQTEVIPESYSVIESTEERKRSGAMKDGYWKRAYSIAGIDMDDLIHDDTSDLKRIDDYWLAVSNLKDENGLYKYSTLWALVKCVLVISHGNADPERGFSINKHVLAIHGSNTSEQTLESIRLVKDYLIKCGGVDKIHITKKLLLSCKSAYSRYHKDLEEKKKMALAEESIRKAKEVEKAREDSQKLLKKAKDEELKIMSDEISVIKTGIVVAEQSITEGNDRLSEILKDKVILTKGKLVEELQKVQSKIDMGVKRKRDLSEQLDILEKKKRLCIRKPS